MKEELKELATAIKGYVQKSVSDLSDRIKALESREIPSIDDIVKSIPVPKDGANGKDGNDGNDGIDGKDGEKGIDGINGENGQDGKDALDLEIMPSIDSEKSYPRGIYASHNNGIWRAYQRTDGMKGWECLVAGIASLEIEQLGERGISIKSVLSDGKEINKTIDIPAMIYRGVFTQGEYLPGDSVTWGGSLWHCNAATSDKPGETNSKGWTLAVKKGRDGKDGKDGKDLVKGVSI